MATSVDLKRERERADRARHALEFENLGKVMRSMPHAERPALLTADEAAATLNCSKWTLYQLVHKGEIPYRRIGKRILIPKEFFSPDKAQAQVTA